MKEAYLARPVAIQECINVVSEGVTKLRSQRDDGGGDDPVINRALRKEQTKVINTINKITLINCYYS